MSAFNIQIKPVEVLPIMTETLDSVQLNVEASHTEIEIIFQPTLVNTDEYFLRTILRNLLQNAIKSAGRNGKVSMG